MHAEFVSLADVLRPKVALADALACVPNAPASDSAPNGDAGLLEADVTVPVSSAVDRDAIRDVRCFRAAVADAVALAASLVMRDLASDVLARELAAAPCDLHALIVRLTNDHTSSGPLRVRISEHDGIGEVDLPIVRDSTLQPGDAMLECANGIIDARLGVRLREVLDRMTERQ